MDLQVRKEIAKYLHENEKAILEAEGHNKLLKEEVAMCKVTSYHSQSYKRKRGSQSCRRGKL
jgi:hypothetical protein